MTNALAVYERMNELTTAANALHASGFFSDVKTQAQAMVKVMAGAEIGLPPFASMSGIHIVQGKPVLGANLIATLVKNDPRYNYRVKRADNEACVLEWYEAGKPAGESSFTLAEAQAAGLTGKDNWRKYPSDMLFARALTRGARRYAPGVFGGAPIYTPDELGVETDEEGHIIEGQIVTRETPPAPRPATATNGHASAVAEAYRRSDEMHPNDPGPLADDPLPAAILALPNSSLAFSGADGATRFIATLTDGQPRDDNRILEAADRLIAARADGAKAPAAVATVVTWYQAAVTAAGDRVQDDLFGDAEYIDRQEAAKAALATARGVH